MTVAPAFTGSGLSVFTIDRSAWSAAWVTVVPSVSELFAAFGSAVADETEAVLLRVVAAPGAVAVRVMSGAAPAARLARVQLIAPPEGGLQVQPVPEAVAFVTPAGSVSVTVREVAVLGPAFETASV